jgi:hypothetical protein
MKTPDETETLPSTQDTMKPDLESLLDKCPELGYTGWQTNRTSLRQHVEDRDKLRMAVREVELCRRMFRDPRFREARGGRRYTAYHLKHVAENWSFDANPEPEGHYNFYVCQGSAAAAALLEGLTVVRQGVAGCGSIITVPNSAPVAGSPCRQT